MRCVQGEIKDFDKDGSWIDVFETPGGGAVIKPQKEEEMINFLDKLFARSLEKAEEFGEFNVRVSDNNTEVALVGTDGTPMSFDKVMAVLFE